MESALSKDLLPNGPEVDLDHQNSNQNSKYGSYFKSKFKFGFKFAAFAVGPYQTGPFGGPLAKRDEGENQLHSVDLYDFIQ